MSAKKRAKKAGSGRRTKRAAQSILERADSSLLEVIDHVLNKGVVVGGEVILGVAEIDLIYLRLSAILCAADRVLDAQGTPR